jgi:predicted kinase/soluble P-type ATPase
MKEAIILMGLPLAGKTTWIEENKIEDSYTLISADKIKEEHPDYKAHNCEHLHEYSVKAAEDKVNELSNKNDNIVFDSGSINNSYTKRIISTLKDKEYHVKLVHIKTPYRVCIERSKIRFRKVPEQAIINKAIKEKSQYYKLLELVDETLVVDYFTNKHLFVDMDGVICALSTLPIINGEIDFVNAEVHRYLQPVTLVINKLFQLIKSNVDVYILSAIPNSFSLEEKNEWLDKYFNIPKSRRFFVNQGRHKAEMLENLSTKLKINKQDMTMIDDIHNTLYMVEKRGMNAIHISEFLITEF